MMRDSAQWIRAKARGDTFEAAALATWARLGFAAYVRPGAHRSDLLIQARVECKLDLVAARTGRVAVEFSCGGKPSGIATSDADLWLIATAGECLVLPVGDLRRLVESGPFRITHAGDGKRALVVLVPLLELRRCASLVLPAGSVAP